MRCGVDTRILAGDVDSPVAQIPTRAPDDGGEDVCPCATAGTEGAQMLHLDVGGQARDSDAVVLHRIDRAGDMRAMPR